LSKGKQVIPLSEELQGLRAYLELQKIRYLNRLSIYYQIDEFVLNTPIPNLTLQPLVENSICHGLCGEKESISIVISSKVLEDMIEIKIQDDGIGMLPSVLDSLRFKKVDSGFGFNNIDDRLKLHFGQQYGLQVYSESGEGTVVIVKLPFTHDETKN